MTTRPLPPTLPHGRDWLPLINGGRVLLDAEDLLRLCHIRWYRNKAGYVVCAGGGRKAVIARQLGSRYMHRLLLNASVGQTVDHINRDRADNRRSNLRLASAALNGHNAKIPRTNTSGYHGVRCGTHGKGWQAEISIRGKRHFLGRFATAEAASVAYAAVKARVLAELAQEATG